MQKRTKRKKRLSQEEWREHLESWRESGESQATYCRRNKINQATFSRQVRLSQPQNPTQKLVQLPVMPPQAPRPGVLEFQIKNPRHQNIKFQIDLSDADTVTWRLAR